MKNWGLSDSPNKKLENWPVDEAGEKVPPVRLMHLGGAPTDMSVELSMLDAYNIPYFLEYPNSGDFGIVIMGHAGSGVDIFIPETMLEEAQDIFNAEITDEISEETKNEEVE